MGWGETHGSGAKFPYRDQDLTLGNELRHWSSYALQFCSPSGGARTQSLSGRMEATSNRKISLGLSHCKIAKPLWEQHTDDPQTKVKVVTIEGIKDQLVGLQQWRCRITKKTLSITEECRGLQLSIDTCDLIMRDKAGFHYLHFGESINILPWCFNHAKHVFPMRRLIRNLKAIQVANVLGVERNGSAATFATLKQREAGAGVGVCNAITSVLLALLHKKSKEAAMYKACQQA